MSLLACGCLNKFGYQDTENIDNGWCHKSDLHTSDMEVRDVTNWVPIHFGSLGGVILNVTDSF